MNDDHGSWSPQVCGSVFEYADYVEVSVDVYRNATHEQIGEYPNIEAVKADPRFAGIEWRVDRTDDDGAQEWRGFRIGDPDDQFGFYSAYTSFQPGFSDPERR